MKKGPFEVLKSKKIYKNPWISVSEDQVIRPDGKEGIFGIVEMVPGVSVLPLDSEGFVYLTREFHYAIGEKSIEVVSGGIDSGEEPLAAAKRELLEELGIEAKECVDLGYIDPFTTVVKSRNIMFLARELEFKKPKLPEQIDLVKVKLEEAVKMVVDSEITHGGSCVLILKAARYLNL
jgi:ADP-ribose pyrophosphatase